MVDQDKIGAMVDWVISGSAPPKSIGKNMQEFGERLLDAGVSVCTVTVFTRTIDPLVLGKSITWTEDAGFSQMKWSHDEF